MSKRLVFLDLETTGLDPQNDTILEVGIVIYDCESRQALADANWVGHFDSRFIQEGDIPKAVWDMHLKNGLWAECQYEALTIQEHSDSICDFIDHYGAWSGPMCGKSIHFDREFLRHQLPGVFEAFNHRLLDVSTLGNIAEYFPDVLDKAPDGAGSVHRAVPDCYLSIDQLEYYLDQLKDTYVSGWNNA